MDQFKHKSARRKSQYEDKVSEDLGKYVTKALKQEEKRKNKKEAKNTKLKQSSSYKVTYKIKFYMDDRFLDPILGFILPGFGDVLTQALTLPFIYVSLFKIRSIPLTLAILFNSTLDMLIGSIPFGVGGFLDIFFRSFRRSHSLIVGFVEDDREVIRTVNKRAIWMAIGIALICYLIYLILPFVVSLTSSIYDWVVGLFA